MFKRGHTIILITLLLISSYITAKKAESSDEKWKETADAMKEGVQDIRIQLLEYQIKELKQEVKRGNQLQIYFALLTLTPIPHIFYFGYKKIIELWREGDRYDRTLAITIGCALIYILGVILFLAEIFLL